MSLLIRSFRESNLGKVARLAQLAGWPENTRTVKACYNLGQGNWVEACVNDTFAGCAAISNPNKGIGIVGYFLVDPEFRGSGVGEGLVREGVKRMGHFNYRANGFNNMMHLYRKAFPNMVVAFPIQTLLWYPKSCPSLVLDQQISGYSIFEYKEEKHFDAVLAYDSEIYPVDRKDNLKYLLSLDNDCKAFVTTKNKKVTGYGCIVRLTEFLYKIGPLFADSDDIGNDICKRLLTNVPGSAKVTAAIIDSTSAEAVLTERSGVVQRSNLTRFYTQHEIMPICLDKVYALSDLSVSLI